MTENIRAIIAVLETLEEEPDGGPESAIYLALGGELSNWYILKATMLETGLIEDVNSWITVTPKGIELVKKLRAKATKEQTA
jgi:hypothetical protein